MQLCAARTGQILNYSELARDANVSVHAAREWISILESTMQIFLLKPYFQNISKRLIKSPKLYFLDTGLAAYLTKWHSAQTLYAGAMSGAFLETFVISEILKSYLFRGIEPPLYYFRDKQGHEVDLLIERDQKLYPIEIKQASNIKPDDSKHIEYIRSYYPNLSQGTIISLSKENRPLSRNTNIIPASTIN